MLDVRSEDRLIQGGTLDKHTLRAADPECEKHIKKGGMKTNVSNSSGLKQNIGDPVAMSFVSRRTLAHKMFLDGRKSRTSASPW